MSALPENGEAWWARFQDLLEKQMEWPSVYVFKFIAPQEGLDALKSVFGQYPVRVRASSKGNYYSVTARMEMHSSDEVIAVYKAAAQVDGVISL